MLRTLYFRASFALALIASSSSPASAETRPRIESPADGTIVFGGESLEVSVSAPAGAFTFVEVIGAKPIGFSQMLNAPPYKFVFQIPKSHFAPGPCHVTALGKPASGDLVYSEPVSVDIERSDAPVALWSMTPELSFVVGDKRGFDVSGKYADGSRGPLERSTFTKYETDPLGIVSVAPGGLVTALAPGSATIIVTHKGFTTRVKVSVSSKER